MSPKVLQQGALVFWFHSYDALHENRASVHVGISSQDDENDAKVWLEPIVEIARSGRTLKKRDLHRAIKTIEQHLEYLMEQWYDYKDKAS